MGSKNKDNEKCDTLIISVEGYQELIVEMVKGIESPKILKLLYGFTRSGYKEEKAGRN